MCGLAALLELLQLGREVRRLGVESGLDSALDAEVLRAITSVSIVSLSKEPDSDTHLAEGVLGSSLDLEGVPLRPELGVGLQA